MERLLLEKHANRLDSVGVTSMQLETAQPDSTPDAVCRHCLQAAGATLGVWQTLLLCKVCKVWQSLQTASGVESAEQ
jgi:hypothetical protein